MDVKANIVIDRPGSPDERARLVELHYDRLRRLAGLLLDDREEAKEIVQEVFMKAHEAVMQAHAPDDWAAWLTRVTVNACRDRRRYGWWIRFRRRTESLDGRHVPTRAPSPLAAAIDSDTQQRIWQAFRRLPSRQREVFVLRHIEEWSTNEVADALRLDPGTVKRHLFRAIRHL